MDEHMEDQELKGAADQDRVPTEEHADDRAIRRAANPGCVLTVLACLTSVTLAGMLVASIPAALTGEKMQPELMATMVCVMIALSPTAAGYWLLAVAARRGNPLALLAAAMVMLVQSAMLMLVFARTLMGMEAEAGLRIIWSMALPVILAVVLLVKWRAVKNLQRQGLWDRVYGTAKPSNLLCVLGCIMLVLGMLVANVAIAAAYRGMTSAAERDYPQARAFTAMLLKDEKPVMDAIKNLSILCTSAEINDAIAKLTTLERRVDAIKADTADGSELVTVLTNYAQAVALWKDGLAALKLPQRNEKKAGALLSRGDQVRLAAFNEFDLRYGLIDKDN